MDATSKQQEELMDLMRAAQFLGITKDSMYTLKRYRRVAYHKIGKKLRFRRSDLEAYLEQCRVPAAHE